MTRALHADSYHFELVAPAGQYIYCHHLEQLGSRAPIKQDQLVVSGIQQYARLYHEEGRSVAHLYVRKHGQLLSPTNSGNERRPNIKSVIRFRELPPGVLGSAALLAGLTAVVVTFFAMFRIGLDGNSTATDVPAVLLALPGFLSGAIGRSIDSDRLGRTSLTAFFGLAAVAALSLSSALLYVLDAAKKLHTELTLQLAVGTKAYLHTDVLWLALSLASIVLAIFLLRERRNQVKYYFDMVKRVALDQEAREVHDSGR